MTAEPVGAQQAAEWGMIWRAVDDESLVPARPGAEMEDREIAGLGEPHRHDHEGDAGGSERKQAHGPPQPEGAAAPPVLGECRHVLLRQMRKRVVIERRADDEAVDVLAHAGNLDFLEHDHER